jgi:hypothetical protein
VNENVIERIGPFFLVPVRDFLALNAISGPGHGVQTLDANVLFAMQTHSEGAFVDAVQRGPDITQKVRFPIQIANRKLAFGGVLDFIQGIRALLDCNAFTVP